MNYNNWYAVAVQTNKERSCVAQLFERKSVMQDTNLEDATFLERKEIKVQKNGKRSVRHKKLMPGYVLVQVKKQAVEKEDGTVQQEFPPATFDLITQTTGIQGFVNLNKKRPVPMKSKEVKKMFDLCDDAHLEVKQNIQADYQEGDILDVVAGPFKGYKVEVMNVQGDKILGHLDMFGRTIPAEFTKTQVYKNETTRS